MNLEVTKQHVTYFLRRYTMNDELYHYGIKGMKWGVRKGRKSGGLGKKLKKKFRAAKTIFQNASGSRSSNALRAYRKKDINRMSNKDLQTAINRMNLEKQYRSLTKRDLTVGNRLAKDILAYGGTALVAYNTYKQLSDKGLLPKWVRSSSKSK